MTATSTPRGLVPVRHRAGGSIRDVDTLVNGIASGYATSIFTGDPITIAAGAGTITIAGATNASPVVGVFQGCEYTDANGRRTKQAYWPASTVATNIIAYFTSDPNIEYEIQANGVVAQTAIGNGAAVVLGTGNTRSGQSNTQLSSSLAGANASCQFKIVGLGGNPNYGGANAWGDAFTVLRVVIGLQARAFQVGSNTL